MGIKVEENFGESSQQTTLERSSPREVQKEEKIEAQPTQEKHEASVGANLASDNEDEEDVDQPRHEDVPSSNENEVDVDQAIQVSTPSSKEDKVDLDQPVHEGVSSSKEDDIILHQSKQVSIHNPITHVASEPTFKEQTRAMSNEHVESEQILSMQTRHMSGGKHLVSPAGVNDECKDDVEEDGCLSSQTPRSEEQLAMKEFSMFDPGGWVAKAKTSFARDMVNQWEWKEMNVDFIIVERVMWKNEPRFHKTHLEGKVLLQERGNVENLLWPRHGMLARRLRYRAKWRRFQGQACAAGMCKAKRAKWAYSMAKGTQDLAKAWRMHETMANMAKQGDVANNHWLMEIDMAEVLTWIRR